MTTAEIIRPPPERDAGQWADDCRILPKESPEPGPWRTDRVPFWRLPYACFSDPAYSEIIVVCGSQMGKTEGMFNIIGHRLDDGPYVPALYIGPTEKQVKSVSKDRVDKMLRSTKSLWDKTERGQRYGVSEKWIAGVRLGFAWAGSATELASNPAGLAVVDERDRMSNDVGGEGDPVEMTRARLKNYPGSKLGVFSTPTTEGASPIWDLLDSGTLHFWAWRCKHCQDMFVPQISLLNWPEGQSVDMAAKAATIACPHCGGIHENSDKHNLNAGGFYIRHRKLNDREPVDDGVIKVLEHYVIDEDPPELSTASFWMSGLASPWASFFDVAKALINAYKSGEQERIQAVINTWGGELFRVKGEAPEWEEVGARRLEYPPMSIPSRQLQVITLGADVQKYGIYYVIRGWGFGNESWLLEEDYLTGETEYDNVWISLGQVLQRPVKDRLIQRAFIDSGYRPGDVHRRPDHAVYTFCRRHPGLAFPTKGHDTQERPLKFNDMDYSPGGGRVIKGGIRICHIDTDYFKRWIHGRINWPEDQPGGWHLHANTSDDYCRQRVAEELVIKSSGRPVWVRRSKDNHFLDCEVGATAAAQSLNIHKLQPVTEASESKTQPENHGQQATQQYSRRELF